MWYKNRDEKAIAGYRDVLNTIHNSHDYISVTGNIILQLHRDLTKYSESSLGGTYKITQNYLKETKADGTEFIRFTPVPPYETAPCIDAICENYRTAIESHKVDPLLLIPVFIHDFLCIHPFNDGNGRMSRLLTLLLLYRNGYEVGKYISIENISKRQKARIMMPLKKHLMAGMKKPMILRRSSNICLVSFLPATANLKKELNQ